MLNKLLKLLALSLLFYLIFLYFDELGIFFIENILVIDVTALGLGTLAASKSVIAKKTFLAIVKKIGYKKFFISIFWVILKRYVIEAGTNYFKKHSFERFKRNFIEVLKLKALDIKNSSFSKKLLAFISFITGSSMAYYLLTNYLSKIIIGLLQKFFYALVLLLWNFVLLLFAMFAFILSSLIQMFFLIKLINYIERFTIVKFFYSLINRSFKFLLSSFDKLFGTKFHLGLIRLSRNIDEYFASILDKNFTAYERIQRKRDRHINSIEYISIQRQKLKLKRKKEKSTLFKEYNSQIKKYIKKEKTWREKRELYYKKLEEKRTKIRRRVKKRVIRKNKLILPNKEN